MTAAPTPRSAPARALAPDLARGWMLLLIALANVPIYLVGRPRSTGNSHPVDGSWPEQIVQAVMIATVDARVYPMFAFLFGYGLVLSHRRQVAQGKPASTVTADLIRRNLWLIVFGAAHAALLWGGDVLGAYGLCGVLLVAMFLRRSNLTVLIAAALGTLVLVAIAALSVAAGIAALGGEDITSSGGTGALFASVETNSFTAAAVARASVWPIQTLYAQGPLSITVPVAMLLGIYSGRRRYLEQPELHRRTLAIAALGGIGLGWTTGLPHALAHVGIINGLEGVMWAFTWPHKLTGLACGIGYIAAFGTLAARLRHHPLGPLTTGAIHMGRRSLSCYLAQSAICAPLLSGWGVGLGSKLNSATIALFAVGAWLATLLWATSLGRRDQQGPAERLLATLRSGVRGPTRPALARAREARPPDPSAPGTSARPSPRPGAAQ